MQFTPFFFFFVLAFLSAILCPTAHADGILTVPCSSAAPECPRAYFCSAGGGAPGEQGICQECDGGFYCPAGTAQRLPCPPGTFCSWLNFEPIACSDGYISSGMALNCIQCPTPWYTSNASHSRCDVMTGLSIALIVIASILVLTLVVFFVRRSCTHKKPAVEMDISQSASTGYQAQDEETREQKV